MQKVELLLIDTGYPCLGKLGNALANDRYHVTSFDSAEAMLIHVMCTPKPERQQRCALLKHRSNGMSGIEAQNHLRKLDPSLSAIIYSDAATPTCVIDAWRAGADDYLLYPFNDDEVKKSLHRVMSKRKEIPEIPRLDTSEPSDDLTKRLTARERDVMRLIVDGHKNSEICQTLSISLATVKMHRSNLMRKLCVHNAAQLSSVFHKALESRPSV
jgi:DNA-binding NarL/FixJ family response regulator